MNIRTQLDSKREGWWTRASGSAVYDVRGGGDYIDAAMSFLGINDEQLLQNVAQRVSKRVKRKPTVPWPSNVDDLEEGEEVCELLVQLLTWLKQLKRKSVDLSPTTLSLASMIMYYITGQRTNTVINMGVNVHGMTRSKDLMETLHKSGVCISYADTLRLYDSLLMPQHPSRPSGHRTDIKYEFLDPCNTRNPIIELQCQPNHGKSSFQGGRRRPFWIFAPYNFRPHFWEGHSL